MGLVLKKSLLQGQAFTPSGNSLALRNFQVRADTAKEYSAQFC
jgi:hypothetical protein